MATRIDEATRQRLRDAFLSPDLTLCMGPGDATTPGSGLACTMVEVNLVLTGESSDRLGPDVVSPLLRGWVVDVNDMMPHEMRNGRAWREAAVGIAGTGNDVEGARAVAVALAKAIVEWAWRVVNDPVLDTLLPTGDADAAAWRASVRDHTQTLLGDPNRHPLDDSRRLLAGVTNWAIRHQLFSMSDTLYDLQASSGTAWAWDSTSAAVVATIATGAVGYLSGAVEERVLGRSDRSLLTDFWLRCAPAKLLTELIAISTGEGGGTDD